uniref:Uncharacterized protein n=1 Tax=Haptolina ericina TaxID=156174 RepID=A0A6T9PG12_9EUKA|mmetsp:Transcript_7440/g.16634  ORF Transcript_7440/g.16634 Transcript_7440/m.16634 type:complete len:134 (+) Transcript_7440:241-642(+)
MATCLKSPSLLQHLGLVGAAAPHSGSRGEYHSPLVHMNERARQRAHTVHNMETKLLGVVLQGMPVEHMAPILPRHMRGGTMSGQRQLDIAAISSMAALTGNTREQPAAPGKKDRLDKATAPTKQGPLALCGGP